MCIADTIKINLINLKKLGHSRLGVTFKTINCTRPLLSQSIVAYNYETRPLLLDYRRLLKNQENYQSRIIISWNF